MAVGLRDLVEVLGAAHAAHVAELVGGEQLEHQQIGVLLLHHPSALGHERVGRSREVGCTEVTERTTSSPKGSSRCAIPTSRPRRPWRSSTSKTDSRCTPSRGAKFERMPCSAGVAPVSIDEKQTTVRAGYAGSTAEVLGALAGEPVHHRSVRLPEAAAVAAVHDDHVDRCGPAPACAGCPLGAAADSAASGASNERAAMAPRAAAIATAAALRSTDPAPGFLGQQRARAERDQELRQLLERVAARGIRVREHEAPEPQAVGPGRAGAQVVVDRAPDDDREERIAGERAREQSRRPPRLEQRQGRERGEPEQRTATQRKREARQDERAGARPGESQTERALRRQSERRGRQQHEQGVHDREGPPLVEDVPRTRRPDLDRPGRPCAAGRPAAPPRSYAALPPRSREASY